MHAVRVLIVYPYHSGKPCAAVVYPELVSAGVSKTRKFKWLVKVGASIVLTPPDLYNNLGRGGGEGGFPGNQKKNLDMPRSSGYGFNWWVYLETEYSIYYSVPSPLLHM